MKHALNNPKFWQKKRGELPVNGNAEADWLQMQSLLDQRMPVSNPVKKPFRLKTSKWWFNGLIVTSSVVVIYAVTQLYLSNRHRPVTDSRPQTIHRDTLNTPAVLPQADTAQSKPVNVNKDSLHNQPATIKNNHAQKDTSSGRGGIVADTSRSSLINNNIPHRDSLISPVNISPLKSVHDSTKVPVIHNQIIQKDTPGKGKGGPKKRRRSKVGIFV